MADARANFVSNEDYVARARALAPVLRERAAMTNEMRRVPDETIADFKESGLFGLLKPERFGGADRGLEPYLDSVIELAQGCGSAGWVFSVLSIHVFHVGLFPLAAQEDVWGDNPDAIIASSYMPGAKAARENGGFRITGRWKFSSGCDAADWFILGASHGMRATEPPRPEVWFCLVPRADVEIVDTWHVIGLKGTGSKDVATRDAYVPAHRILNMADALEARTPGREVNPGPLFALPMYSVFPLCIASPAVGVAKGAVNLYIEEMKTRIVTSRGGESVADYHATQTRLGEAAALADCAELLLRRDAKHTMDVMRQGRPLTVEERVRNRRDHAFAADLSVRAVDLLYKMTGGAGLHNESALQRHFRDAHAIGSHIANNWDISGPLYGRVMLGRPPGTGTY